MKETYKEEMLGHVFKILYDEGNGMYKAQVDDVFLRWTYSSERFAIKEARQRINKLDAGQ